MKGTFVFLNSNKKEIEIKAVNKLNFKEELIINKSIEMFKDDDPCIIHRTYAINKIGFELLDEVNDKYNNLKEIEFKISEVPDFILTRISFPENTKFLRII